MSPEFLDWIFPFFVLTYGAMMTFVLSCGPLVRLGQSRLPEALWKQVQSHRVLALISLIVGGLWSLQNIWSRDLPPFLF